MMTRPKRKTSARSDKGSRSNARCKELRQQCLTAIATELELLRANNNSKIPYGAVARLVNEYKDSFPWLNKDMVKNHIRRLNKLKETKESTSREELNTANTLITLASTTGAGNTTTTNTTTTSSISCSIYDSNFAESMPSHSLNPGPSSIEVSNSNNGSDTCGKPGRPKGTTIKNSLDLKRRIELASQDAAERFSEERKRAKVKNTRAKRGVLTEIIEECKSLHGVPENCTIEPECIRSRAKRGNFSGGIAGNTSPMLAIEPYLVEMIRELEKMRVPISSRQGLALANSIISGTAYEKQVLEWKENHCVSSKNNPEQQPMVLGKGYWSGFMKRNKDLVKAKKGVKFDSKRADWCTYQNFELMYNEVYEAMVEAGIASKLDTPTWFDKSGNIVEEEGDAFGLQSKYILLRPDKLLFVDEVGSNTSQAKDGNIGGEKFLCSSGGRPQQRANTKDAHFTVLGFTTASGNAVMCCIIFAAKELDPLWVQGLDPFAEWEGGELEVRKNTGKGKRHPQGPVCTFKGKMVPCFCGCSETGSITSDLLAAMLQFMDDLNLFDRQDGINPFLLLDGHGSRFELPFLEYVTCKDHVWKVCIGVPYGTSYWQVGDSAGQNGCFKMALTKGKRNLVKKKESWGLEGTIEKTDIVGLVTYAWEHSFARQDTNKKAVAERGWGPLNYNILLNPEINSNKPSDNVLTSDAKPEDLNLVAGIAGTLTNKIVLFRNREAARTGENAAEVLRQRKKTAQEAIDKGKRLTAGLHVAAGKFTIGEECLANLNEKIRKEQDKKRQSMMKLKDEYDKLLAKVTAVRALNKPPEKWSAAQLHTMVKWYKCDDDNAIPSKKTELLTRYLETCNREERVAPPLPEMPHQPPSDGELPPIEADDDGAKSSDEVIEELAV